ncbi:MAG: hypothetical protein D6814_04020, partial [Calditrichaeota bacterium]
TYHGKIIEGRAVWANPNAVATNDSTTRAFIAHCKKANINLIVLLVKFSDTRLFYHSKKFPQSIAAQFKDFDPLAAVIREAHRNGIRVHAWVCSFTESADGPVMQQHPEWAVRNPEGKIPTETEYLSGGRKYYINWMCPARRPGYTDQWLIPMIEEIVTDYDVDGIHHDYVRYPGDVAPDSYCFCDYCLDQMLKYAHFYYETFPDSFFALTPTLPNLIANWWSDPTVKPMGWERWDRKQKAQFLLKGSFIRGGPADLDYFFYTYRQDAINRFVREAWEHASAIKPDIEFSAAVFKNPITSGRFIGQRWTDFSPWIDMMMPMVYRSHFPPGDFDTFLRQLAEYTRYEYKWAKNRTHLEIGLDVTYIYNEERFFIRDALAALDSIPSASVGRRQQFIENIRDRYARIQSHLAQISPQLEQELTKLLSRFTPESIQQNARLREIIKGLQTHPPDDYYPKEKLRRAIATVREAGANGIIFFEAGQITQKNLWPVLEQAFPTPSIDPDQVGSASEMSIVTLKALRRRVEAMKRQRNLLILAIVIIAVGMAIIWRKKKTL